MHVLVGVKYDFLKTVRLIASGLWNTVLQLLQNLEPQKPPYAYRLNQFNWKKEFETVLVGYNVDLSY